MVKRVILLAIISVLISSLSVPVMAQTAGGTISGQLINGTVGGSSVAGVEVRLEAFVNFKSTGNLTARTQGGGNFAFNNLSTEAHNTYRIMVTYQEADYFSQDIIFGQGENSKSANITVYDSTTSQEAVTVETAHTIITPGEGNLEVTVVYDFIYNTDRAYVGSGDVLANGKRKTLMFTIPADATDVRYGGGLLPDYVLPSHEGFIDTLAVLPGVKEIVYGYKVPYSGGTYKFQQKLNYPAAWFNLLVQGERIKVTSNQLDNQGPLDMGQGNVYLYLVGHNFTSGQIVSATLSGLPGSMNQTTIILVAALVVIAGSVLVYLLVRIARGKRRVQSVRAGSMPDDAEQRLLTELARLDDDFAAGKVPEEVYRARRAAKKAQLIKLINASREASDGQ